MNVRFRITIRMGSSQLILQIVNTKKKREENVEIGCNDVASPTFYFNANPLFIYNMPSFDFIAEIVMCSFCLFNRR